MTPRACSGWSGNHRDICKHGFIQTVGCHSPSRIPTWCIREDIPVHWLKDDGSPRFYPKPEQPR